MDKWFKDILPDKDPYHNRGRDQMRKKGVRNSSACVIVQAPGVIPNPLPEVNLLMVEIPKPYIFVIKVTRQVKCLITHVPGVIPHPLPEVNFLMV